MLAFLLLPLVALLLRIPLAQLLANLANREVAQAISLSMITTALTVLLTLLLGTPVAYLLARRRFRGHTALDTLIDLPMVLPPSVAGIALLVAFGRRGMLGQYLSIAGIELAFTSTAVVLAQLFVAAPFYIKAATAGFAGIDRELEQAAALDGASARQVFRYVTVPLAWTSLFGGAVMTWARALGEFGATIIFAGNFVGRTQTMPLAIYQGFEQELTVALTLSVILLAVSFLVLFIVRGLLRQQL
jgi:molybdate transport system permease protein